MDKIVVEGGHRLKGEVKISGSKNAALPILVSALLVDGECIFHNVPKLNVLDMLRVSIFFACGISSGYPNSLFVVIVAISGVKLCEDSRFYGGQMLFSNCGTDLSDHRQTAFSCTDFLMLQSHVHH